MKIGELQVGHNYVSIRPYEISPPENTSGKISTEKTKSIGKNFSDILGEKVNENAGLKFSAHAMRRLDDRQINLTAMDLSRLTKGVKLAEEKGAKSSLILVDKNAYIVSVKNRTVVTALTEEATLGNVFTNIDSVAIV
ncbi:MAG TPA: flagellar protein [Candidatus Marinimicrobia bacterium]|nr:flagellar protein [Candidatus Neomarinimicrobiota bacterium]